MFKQSDYGESITQVNSMARRARHKKVFAQAGYLVGAGILSISRYSPFGGFISVTKKAFIDKKNSDPRSKLFKVYSFAVTALFVISIYNPSTNANNFNSLYIPSAEGIESFYLSEGGIMTDQDGYIAKINPQTELSDRSVESSSIPHVVQPGESISMIAQEYGVKTETVLWENGLNKNDVIRAGRTLFIPPVDGVRYTVKQGDSITKVAQLFSVEATAISRQNGLNEEIGIVPGQSLFIPGAKPLPVIVPPRDTPARVTTGSRVIANSSEIGSPSTSTPGVGKELIWPTRGKITQGFKRGHYAIDIADRSKPPIWAAASGTVVTSSTGSWSGGYGNHIIIDHGNGMKTLYAHLETVSVSQGQQVGQGDVIGQMGRTGRVYGVTGIHLHFEVHKNGVKVNPSLYF